MTTQVCAQQGKQYTSKVNGGKSMRSQSDTKDYRQLRNTETEKTVFSGEEYTNWLFSHHDLLSPAGWVLPFSYHI